MKKKTICLPPSGPGAGKRRSPLRRRARQLYSLMGLLALLPPLLLSALLVNLWTMVLYSSAVKYRARSPLLSQLMMAAGGWGLAAALRLRICTTECLRGI